MVTKRRNSTEQDKTTNYYEIVNEEPEILNIPSETRSFEYSIPASQGVTYSEPTVRSKKVSESDLMPSIRTMSCLKEENKIQVNNRENLERKTKIMLAVYMLVVAVLSVIVIATGIAVSNASNRVSALESEYAVQSEVLSAQNDQINKLSDSDYIKGKAFENGMENIENASEVPLMDLKDPVSYEKRTNWFDSFCRWVSSLIGG